ncbi:MAG: SoxXA-binding protein [bacterium]
MLKTIFAGLVSSLILISGCATATSETSTESAPTNDFAAAWDAADAKRQEAAAVGYEWRDTKKMLKKAKEQAEAGETDAAMKLVAKAHEESSDAIAQAARESTIWQARVPQ